jgi:cytochrome P450
MYKVIELFDGNIVTTEGDEWLRHRRLTARGLGDRVNRAVWKETLKGARKMMGEWFGSDGKVQKLESDMMGLTLGVMWRAGFGMKRWVTFSWDLGGVVRSDCGWADRGYVETKRR